MFGDNNDNKKKEADKGKVETILGAGTSIDGNIYTRGSLRIEGTVKGNVNIKAEGDLFIGEEGKINTDVEARNVVIAGLVEGNVIARKKLELLSSGTLKGDLKTKNLKIEEGAIFDGLSKPLQEITDKNNNSSEGEGLNKKKHKKNSKQKEKNSK